MDAANWHALTDSNSASTDAAATRTRSDVRGLRVFGLYFGLSIPEWRVMAVLGGTPGLSARDVAERTAMDKVQVSRAVESLVRARRVARTEDAEDGRISRLALTARGRAIYDEVVPLALHLEEVFLAALKPGERRQLDVLMAKLSRQAHLLVATRRRKTALTWP